MINVSDSPSTTQAVATAAPAGQEVTLHIPEDTNVPVVETVQASSSTTSKAVVSSGKGKRRKRK